ncbi:hypothetical protein PU629_06485 [Pullulanibacillus sp. KACC 23026]|uniref:hypothetical protein n=1 Tax=Pullulanibacillus sp. KACC 23026 TaxID=3028315 RepID=UPI0023B04C31|nr:hypothetical protein [Pullulanibacillus sp. KACC 23026]WEG14012.1 hypothetical protein PU629_06485 [Pullulanibacillus sp. KACC 23026]
MLQTINIEGSEWTTLCTLTASVNGSTLTFSPGKYINAGTTRYETTDSINLDISTPKVDTDYQVWLAEDGLHVLTKTVDTEFGDLPDNYIDLLAWFTMPAASIDLSNVTINVKKIS